MAFKSVSINVLPIVGICSRRSSDGPPARVDDDVDAVASLRIAGRALEETP